jgi:Flp pilus assembly pilin Flp
MSSRAGTDDDEGKSDVRCAATTRPVSQEVPAVRFEQPTRREEGQTMAEYAVVIGVITPVLVLLFAAMSDAIIARLETVVGFLT